METLTPAACRAARAALGWSMRELQDEAGISLPTIVKIEAGGSVGESTARKLRRAFHRHGVTIRAESGAMVVRIRCDEAGALIAPVAPSPVDAVADLPYVIVRPRKDGTYRVLFEVPARLRPPGWPATRPLPQQGRRRGDLTDKIEVARIVADAAALREQLEIARGGAVT